MWRLTFICTWYVVGSTRFLVSICATICWSEFSSLMVIGRKHLLGESKLTAPLPPTTGVPVRLESKAAALNCWAGCGVVVMLPPPVVVPVLAPPGISCNCICGCAPPPTLPNCENGGTGAGEEITKFNFGFLSVELRPSSPQLVNCACACNCCSCCNSACCCSITLRSFSCCGCNWICAVGAGTAVIVCVCSWDACCGCCCCGCCLTLFELLAFSFFPNGVIFKSGLRRINSSRVLESYKGN